MTLRPSLQKSIALALGQTPDRRLRVSSVIRHDGGRRAVDLIVGSQQFFVLLRDSREDAEAVSGDVVGAAADLIESLGGTAEIA